ncbi:MAG: hypothetical protein J6R32_11540 [Bacteroidales bacterium]|nr:hypothetical protein [Bacteroidales bacterium]
MAIATDITVDIVINDVKVDEYELSDTLDNYTIDEIFNNGYCGAFNPAKRNNFERTTDYGWNVGFDEINGTFRYPFTTQATGGTYNWMTGDTGYNSPDGLYSCVVWLQKESVGSPAYVINSDNISDYRIVTKWNINKFVYVLPSLYTNFAQVASDTWTEQKSYPTAYYAPGRGSMTYHTNRGEEDDETAVIAIYPYLLFDFNGKIYFHAIDQDMDYNMYFSTAINLGGTPAEFAGSTASSFDKTTSIGTSYNSNYQAPVAQTSGYGADFQLSGYPGNNRGTFQWQGPGGYTRWYQISGEDEQNYICGWDHSGYSYQGGYIRIRWLFSKLHDSLLFFANSGVYFQADKIYKPVINDSIVTDYTDDLTTVSDIDDWDGSTYHDVPITPPEPPEPPSEDAEPETFGWGGNEVAGMVRYYLLSQTEMEELQTFMSDASWRMDYRNCIIGMYVVPNGGLFFDAIEPTTLKFRIGLNEAEGVIPQDQELDTGISCLRISGVVNNESAVIELPRMNGNFLDFEPYSKYMVYVPFCGVIPLPDYVAGKEIKVTIFPDVPTCTCTAVVTSEGRKIATAKGAYGSQLPVTSDGDGLKAASVINSLGNIIMGAGEVALGIGTGIVPLAIAGGAQMLGSGLQADLQLGQAYGYSIGASGDTSFFGAGNRCEYYVAYSKWNNPDIDEGELQTNIYGHTYGFVCNKRGLLKDFEGFTVCDNPHVHGFSCTSDEKDEIERLLREGIIIHIPEE